jgi:quinol monooxygenase YgiN
MSAKLNIVARIMPRPEHRDHALAAIRAIVEQTRAEPGCIEFRVNQCQASGDVILYEEWRDEEAFTFHHSQSYTRSVMEAYAQWLRQEPEITRLDPVA